MAGSQEAGRESTEQTEITEQTEDLPVFSRPYSVYSVISVCSVLSLPASSYCLTNSRMKMNRCLQRCLLILLFVSAIFAQPMKRASAGAPPEAMKAGFAKIVITPEKNMWM